MSSEMHRVQELASNTAEALSAILLRWEWLGGPLDADFFREIEWYVFLVVID